MLVLAFRAAQKLDSIPEKFRVGGVGVGVLAIFGAAVWHTPALSIEMNDILNAARSLGERSISEGSIRELIEQDGETLARCEIQAVKAGGEQTLVGEALIAL